MSNFENYYFSVGNLQCISMNDGMETIPAESMVKDISPELWRQALSEHGDSPDLVDYCFNCLYIRSGSTNILVDAGWGKGVQRLDGVLVDRLQAAGLSPADIDILVITHGDVDHIGGLLDPAGKLVFPRAQYILVQEAWNFWTNPEVLARWPEFLTFFGRKTLPMIRSQVRVTTASEEFLPGFQLLLAPGHRPGHCALSISSKDAFLLHLADCAGHPVLLEHPTWHWSADYKPEQTEIDQSRLFQLAVSRQALVFGSHLPFPGVGHLFPHGEGWAWQPLEN